MIAWLRRTGSVVGTSLDGLTRNKSRALLSLLGVGIGVATLMAIVALTQGLTQSFARQLSMMGAQTMYVSRAPFFMRGDWWRYRNRPPLQMKELRALRDEADLLTAVAPMAMSIAEVTHGGERVGGVQVRGTTSDYLETTNTKLADGRFLSPLEGDQDRPVVVIGHDIKERLFVRGDPIGARITVGRRVFTVVGVLGPMGSSFGQSLDTQVIIPIESFLRQFGARRGFTIAAATAPENMSAAEDQAVAVLRKARGLSGADEDNFAINRQSEMLKMFNDNMAVLFGVAAAVGLITLLVGGIGVMNIMMVAVTERTREIGVRRALGAKKSTILFQFLVEAMLVMMVGGVLGTVCGLGGAWLLSQVAPVDAVVDPKSAALGVMFTGVVGLVFGTWPAWRAANLDPIESLRYE